MKTKISALNCTRPGEMMELSSSVATFPPYISDSDPITIGKKIGCILPLIDNPEPDRAKKTADALNRYLTYCYHQLSENPELGKKANILVTQRCGRRVDLKPFESVWGLKPMMIASPTVYEGLAMNWDLILSMQKIRKIRVRICSNGSGRLWMTRIMIFFMCIPKCRMRFLIKGRL